MVSKRKVDNDNPERHKTLKYLNNHEQEFKYIMGDFIKKHGITCPHCENIIGGGKRKMEEKKNKSELELVESIIRGWYKVAQSKNQLTGLLMNKDKTENKELYAKINKYKAQVKLDSLYKEYINAVHPEINKEAVTYLLSINYKDDKAYAAAMINLKEKRKQNKALTKNQ